MSDTVDLDEYDNILEQGNHFTISLYNVLDLKPFDPKINIVLRQDNILKSGNHCIYRQMYRQTTWFQYTHKLCCRGCKNRAHGECSQSTRGAYSS
jgi:hypothetical protein